MMIAEAIIIITITIEDEEMSSTGTPAMKC